MFRSSTCHYIPYIFGCIVCKDVQLKVRTVINSIKASKPLEAVALDFTELEHSQCGEENLLYWMYLIKSQ